MFTYEYFCVNERETNIEQQTEKQKDGTAKRLNLTHNISSDGKPVNTEVGTRCSILFSSRSARKLFS